MLGLLGHGAGELGLGDVGAPGLVAALEPVLLEVAVAVEEEEDRRRNFAAGSRVEVVEGRPEDARGLDLVDRVPARPLDPRVGEAAVLEVVEGPHGARAVDGDGPGDVQVELEDRVRGPLRALREVSDEREVPLPVSTSTSR